MAETDQHRLWIAGIPVDNVTLDEAVERITGFVSSRTPHFGVAINPEKIIKAKGDSELEQALVQSDFNFCDGIGVIWAMRVFYRQRIRERVTGVDLFLRLLEAANEHGWRLYLLGGRPHVLEKVVTTVREQFPKATIAGSYHGYFSAHEEPGLAETIAASHADLIFVGMGSPKQENFIKGNLAAMNVPFAMGVGGSYNVLSGEYRRAPAAIQRMGLEWFYRFVLDPKRLPRILSLPRFVGIVMRSPRQRVETVDFFGITISNKSLGEVVAVADNYIREGGAHLVVTLNGEMAARAFKDAQFLDIVRRADLVVADGVGVVWGARMLGSRIQKRIPGIEFAGALLELAEQRGYQVYLLGAQPDILERAVASVRSKYPGLKLAGYHSGYFDEAGEQRIVDDIRNGHASILLVGMGGGIQEKWIWAHRDLGVPLSMGVGGTFDVWSGSVRRAPKVVQKTGTEWLYRLVVQPSRFRRIGNIMYFIVRVLGQRRSNRSADG
jgi:N-acetylglucosaminyldiphosphoundecaprenol N-acetyl-beta-D-mannosaminyltransferase